MALSVLLVRGCALPDMDFEVVPSGSATQGYWLYEEAVVQVRDPAPSGARQPCFLLHFPGRDAHSCSFDMPFVRLLLCDISA